MTDEEYQIRRKYENRNLMRELDWVAHYPPSGMSNQNRDFIKWLAMTAYDKINELEQTSVPVDDMKLILDEMAKPQWIPVTERLPECEWGAEVGNIEWISCGMVFAGCFGRGGKYRDAYFRTWTDGTEGIDAKDADYWRQIQIPEPPKEGE